MNISAQLIRALELVATPVVLPDHPPNTIQIISKIREECRAEGIDPDTLVPRIMDLTIVQELIIRYEISP